VLRVYVLSLSQFFFTYLVVFQIPKIVFITSIFVPSSGRPSSRLCITRSIAFINPDFAYLFLGVVFNTRSSVRYAYMFVKLCVTFYEIDVSVTLKNVLYFIPCQNLILYAEWLLTCVCV